MTYLFDKILANERAWKFWAPIIRPTYRTPLSPEMARAVEKRRAR